MARYPSAARRNGARGRARSERVAEPPHQRAAFRLDEVALGRIEVVLKTTDGGGVHGLRAQGDRVPADGNVAHRRVIQIRTPVEHPGVEANAQMIDDAPDLGRARLEDSPYYEWFEAYGSDEMEALARRLESLLPETVEDVVAERYVEAMRLERDFFAAHA